MPGSDGPGMGSPAIGNRVPARRRPGATGASTKRSSGAGPGITFRRDRSRASAGTRRVHRRRTRAAPGPAARPSSHPDPAAAPARSAAGGLRAARCQRSVPIRPAGPRRLGRVGRLAALPGRKMQPPGRRRSLLRSRRSRPAARCRASPAALCHNADDFLARFLIRACPIEKGAPCRWHSIRRAVRRPGRSCGHRCLHGRSFRAALAVGLGEVGGRTLIASVERGR